MDNAVIYKAIKQTVQSHVPGSRVLLFGSRARGTNELNSDYDLLIITPTNFTSIEKINLSTRLDRAFVDHIKIHVDLLINSEDEVNEKKKFPGHIIRSAIKEGLFI